MLSAEPGTALAPGLEFVQYSMLKTAGPLAHQSYPTGAAGHLLTPRLPLLFLILVSLLVSSCQNMDEAPAQGDEPFLNTIVSLTFDDGDADNFAIRSALMDNDLRATWYIASGLTGTPGYLTQDQLRTLRQDGHEIGGHSLDHINLTDLPARAASEARSSVE